MFHWFVESATFMDAAQRLRGQVETSEAFIAGKRTVRGWCACCRAIVRFRVKTGANFDGVPNLREGLVCRRCHLSNRNRLMWQAVSESLGDRDEACVALLEFGSPLYRQLLMRYPRMMGSEYLGEDAVAGQTYPRRGQHVRHESVLALSYPDASLDLIAHNDVLEHVEDFRAALAECCRVLAPGGQLVFTMPFYMFLPGHLLRGRRGADGNVEHLQPAEYHGDGLRSQGIYTWHYFSLRLLDDLREAGFSQAQVGLNYDAFAGYVSNHHPEYEVGLMLPVVFRAIR